LKRGRSECRTPKQGQQGHGTTDYSLARTVGALSLATSSANSAFYSCRSSDIPSAVVDWQIKISFIRESERCDLKSRFHQLIVNELVWTRLKTKIAAKWTVQREDDENDHPDEDRQEHHLDSLQERILNVEEKR
jgi:hypothetical protein